MRFLQPFLCFALLIAGLTACTPTEHVRGNIIDEQKMQSIEIGTSSQGDVLRLLGSPTTTSTFDQNTWYYVGEKTSQTGVYRPEVKERLVVAFAFDQAGTVSDITRLDKEDGQDISISDKETPSSGRNFTILQQLLGNLGRFNRGAFGN